MPSGCGRALIIPRELTVEGSELITRPIPETAVLRASVRFHTVETDAGGAVAKGSQVELRLNCTGVGTTGAVASSGRCTEALWPICAHCLCSCPRR